MFVKDCQNFSDLNFVCSFHSKENKTPRCFRSQIEKSNQIWRTYSTSMYSPCRMAYSWRFYLCCFWIRPNDKFGSLRPSSIYIVWYVHWPKDWCELRKVSPVLRQAELNHMKDSDCFDLYQNANLDTTDDMQCFGTRFVQVHIKHVSVVLAFFLITPVN